MSELTSEIKTELILDSLINNVRVTTFELYFPRFLLSQFNTHRKFSRNASSSRAIPVARMIKDHANYIPANWRKHAKGMQPAGIFSPIGNEGVKAHHATNLWVEARENAIESAEALMKGGIAKEQANRLLEPFMFIKTVVTATDYENFFKLRSHPDAQWEIKQLSDQMKELYENSEPKESEMHLPYKKRWVPIAEIREQQKYNGKLDDAWLKEALGNDIKSSVARCARVSYATHDGKEPTLEADLKLYERLVGSEPVHASPAEHQVFSPSFYWDIKKELGWPYLNQDYESEIYWLGDHGKTLASGNLGNGVVQYRKVLEVMR